MLLGDDLGVSSLQGRDDVVVFFGTSGGLGSSLNLLRLLYEYELSVRLNSAPIDCCFDDVVINRFMYTDDLVVFVPSSRRLQILFDLCLTFGEDNYILFNRSKS